MTTNKAAAADIFGDKQVSDLLLNLHHIQDDGYLIRVHTYGISKLERKVTTHERGLLPDDPRLTWRTAGKAFAAPPELVRALKSAAQSLRANLNTYSYDMMAFKPFRFVPTAAAAQWLAEHMRIVERVENLILDYGLQAMQFRDDQREVWAAAAHNAFAGAYVLARQRGQDTMTLGGLEYSIVDADLIASRTAYADRVVTDALQYVLTYEQLLDAIRFTYDVSVLHLGSQIERERAAVAQARAEQSEARLARLEADRGANEEIARQAAARTAIVARAREQVSDLVEPYAEAFAALRARMLEDLTAVTDAITANGYLPGPSVQRARNMAEYYRIMALGDDPAVETLLDALSQTLDRHADTDQAVPVARVEDTIRALVETLSRESAQAARVAQRQAQIAAMLDDGDQIAELTAVIERPTPEAAARFAPAPAGASLGKPNRNNEE